MEDELAAFGASDDSEVELPTREELEAVIDADPALVGADQAHVFIGADTSAESELTKKAFDSYMVLEEDLQLGQHRLLETDNQLVLPSWTQIRFLITSDDVIHA
jgi:heme/copper-type cytochrome/quinol oxidase subunit 2